MVEKFYHAEMMMYYEEVMAQSARNYALTSNKKWEQRYIEFEPLADKLLKNALKKAGFKFRSFFSEMDISNQKLCKMENNSIKLVNDKKSQQAVDYLDSKEYLDERKLMQDGLAEFVKTRYDQVTTFLIAIEPKKEIAFLEEHLATLEQQLKEEKYTTIGHLTSRMAHDFRNPLSVIQISIENIKILYGTDEPKIKQFNKIYRAIDRMTHQVNDVLGYIKGDPPIMNKIMFSDILSESIESLNISNNIKLILPKNDVKLICDKIQFLSVMNNLILNAIQAISDTGTIEITVEENKDVIIIKVKDSGKGISKYMIERIFNPLFTTKQTGIGLGLVSVNSILTAHNGRISVTSPPTIFTITLPRRRD